MTEMLAELGVAPNPLAIDKSLRGGFYPVFCLERIRFLTGRQVTIIDRKTFPFKESLRFHTEWTDMLVHYHSIQGRGSRHNRNVYP